MVESAIFVVLWLLFLGGWSLFEGFELTKTGRAVGRKEIFGFLGWVGLAVVMKERCCNVELREYVGGISVALRCWRCFWVWFFSSFFSFCCVVGFIESVSLRCWGWEFS